MASQSNHMFANLRNSIKDDHLNDILDKIQGGKILSDSENSFLNKFDSIFDGDYKEFSHLSKNQVFDKVCYLLERSKTVICNLYDKDGMINDKIVSMDNFFEEDCCILHLKHGDSIKITDKFLYKISYTLRKDEFYLESQGEFYEKINYKNED